MDIRQQFDELRVRIDDMREFVMSQEFSARTQQERALFNEQLSAMERQSTAMSELINLSDGLQELTTETHLE